MGTLLAPHRPSPLSGRRPPEGCSRRHAARRGRSLLAAGSAVFSVAALVITAAATGQLPALASTGGQPSHPPVHAGAQGMVPYVTHPRITLEPDDSLPPPSWWKGVCDGASTGNYPGSKPLGAVFDGLVACGRPSGAVNDSLVQFFPGAWGEYEWECVELSMRWMYQAWGVEPYGANGNGVVANYPNGAPGYPRLQVVANGTRGQAPQAGDVLSMASSDSFGHTEVVATSSVNSVGNGSLRAITENYGNGNNGWIGLTMSHWVVSSPGMSVLGWLHNPNWYLQMPVLWRLSPTGVLQIKDTGTLGGGFSTIASGIASADVIGGAGLHPVPLVAALSTTGTLLAGYDVGGNRLQTIATGVRSFAISAGAGPAGRPLLGWVTDTGAFELATGALNAAPSVVATGVAKIAISADVGPLDPVMGYISTTGELEIAQGRSIVRSKPSFTKVAGGVSQLSLSGVDGNVDQAVEGYVRSGGYWERKGSSAFTEVATGVRSISVAAVGPSATPLLSYVTNAGQLEVSEGGSYVAEYSGISAATVAASMSSAGFPMITAQPTSGPWFAKEGRLSAGWVQQGTGEVSSGGSAITVS